MIARSLLIVAAAATLLAGCAAPLAPHQPSLNNLEALRTARIGTLQVGEFKPAPELPAERDRTVSVRGLVLHSPADGSYAKFLRQALETELRTSGKLDARSDTVISGLLTDNRMQANGMKDQQASVAAKFIVTRSGRTVYDKELQARATWNADFLGVSAAQSAMNEYTSLYQKLLGQLFADEDFRRATRPD